MAKMNIEKELESINFEENLNRVVKEIEEKNFISSSVYKYKGNFYFKVVKNRLYEYEYEDEDEDSSKCNFYIRMYFWAESDSAAKRAFSDDIEGFSISSNCLNNNLIPGLFDLRYSEILVWIKKTLKITCTESAAYRISDGKFIHRKITTKRHTFYFLSREFIDIERPYVIVFKLRWKMSRPMRT